MRIDNHIIDSPDERRQELTAATQRLLGDTITLGDSDWQVLTTLPGWSRAHLATHLARQAQALTEMAQQIVRTGQPVTWRTLHTDIDLNSGSRRGALELQEALDQSSAALMNAFDQMNEAAWATTLRTSQGSLPASTLIVDRLNEVVIHHADLGLSFELSDTEPGLTRMLLEWNLFRATPRFTQVKLKVVSDQGYCAVVGKGPLVTVRGSETSLLGWITGRKDSSVVLGAEELDLAGPL